MINLKYTYTDTRGLKIPKNNIIKLLKDADKTENEIRIFLGEKSSSIPGFFYYFVESFVIHKNFYYQLEKKSKSKENDQGLNLWTSLSLQALGESKGD